ncbi:MAG: hypothetical protein IJW00_08200 [Clostridia bacterium]|nr:hypothetical protein [Clostridia bacterium]
MSILYNPWQVGDVYAYCFHKAQSKATGMVGKYILLQKIADEAWCDGITLSRLQVYDAVLDELPQNLRLEDFRILPVDAPERFFMNEEVIHASPDMNLLMVIYKKNDYPQKNLTYLGNYQNPYDYPNANANSSAHNWFDIEKWFLYYYNLWQDIEYSFDQDSVIVKKK